MPDPEKNGTPRQAEARPLELTPEYLATLVHELRNPLSPIRTAAELLRSLCVDPRQLHAVNIIERQVVNLTLMLDDTLEAARARRNVFTLTRQIVDLDQIVEPALRAVRAAVDSRRQSLLVSLPSEPVHMQCDPLRLSQALQTLLANSTRHTPEGGAIVLKATQAGRELAIEVSDNGAGIAPERLATLFNVFERGEPATRSSASGSGYSLAILRNVVELHGGTVTAESEGVGRGSRFVIRLPLDSQTPEPRVANEHAGSRRILVIDDHEDGAQMLAQVLARAGHSVLTAATGELGLALAEHFKPESIIVDIGLPGLDGFEVARRLRDHPATRTSLVIAVSGYSLKQFRELDAYSAFRYYLLKPVSPYALLNIIERTLSK